MSFLDSDIPSVDLRSALDGVARRWWIVAISVVVVIGIVFVQESGLGSKPAGLIVVDRTYEAVIETDELAIVKVDPSAIVPVPSLDNQLAILRSDQFLADLRQSTGVEATLDISRSEPKFTITDSIDTANNRVTFLSTGTPSYNFRCVGDDKASCDVILDSYVAETTALRRESILGGLRDGLTLMETLITDGQKRLTIEGLDEAQQNAQRTEIAALVTKRDALQVATSSVTGELIFVTENSFSLDKNTSSVNSSAYGFGLGVGLIIGLLLALQLAALDKTIRYSWQIRRVSKSVSILGSPVARADDAQSVALAAALEHARVGGATSALIYAPDKDLVHFAQDVLKRVPQSSGTIVESFDSATVDQLSGGDSRSVIVLIKAGRTTRHELMESIGLLTSGGNHLLGVALIP